MNTRNVISFFLASFFLFGLTGCQKNTDGFLLIPSKHSGIDFINSLTETVDHNIIITEYFFNGGGVAVGDINNDGLIDIYMVANQKINHLYINEGNFKFRNITQLSGTEGHHGWATGANMVDINNDGFLDIYVCYGGAQKSAPKKNQLFINNGDLTFTEKSHDYGLDDESISTQSVFLDYDKDGDLDMFLLNHQTKNPKIQDLDAFMAQRSKVAADKLYKNDNGYFTDVSTEAGLEGNPLGFGLGVVVGDINQDRWPDIFVANDFLEHDYLYINNQDGTFTESSHESFQHISNFSMGTDMADINNDGLLDILTVDMVAEDNYSQKTSMSAMNADKFWYSVNNGFHYQYMSNALHLNVGNGKFSEVAQLAGVSNTDWSWGALFADFDNDGNKDLYATNGFRRNFRNNDFQKYMEKKFAANISESDVPYLMKELIERMPVKHIPNYMYRNGGNLIFQKVTDEWGLGQSSFSNACAYADFDNDGDLDLIVNNIDEAPFLYQNALVQKNHYLKIRFEGPAKNRFGIGAQVKIWYGGKQQLLEHYPTRGFQSSVSNELHFGVGEYTKIDSLHVMWPDESSQVLKKLGVDQLIVLNYRQASFSTPYANQQNLLFAQVRKSLEPAYKHYENDFNDFDKQVLLPHKYSQMGPALSVGDVNNDGLDDFYIGGAVGQKGRLYIQEKGGFVMQPGPWGLHGEREDIASAFADVNGDGFKDLIVVSGGNEFEVGDERYLDRLYLNQGKGLFKDASGQLPANKFSGSKIAACDFDADGDLDLFIGERHIPHHYPKPASGYLYENKNGFYEDVTARRAPSLSQIGLVTDAEWVDVDGDEDKDLIVVGEWMKVHLYINNKGILELDSKAFTDTEGWWYAVAAADFDHDGDQDLVAGNLGLNYKYKATATAPFEVYASDFDNNAKMDIVLGFHEDGKLYPLRGKQCSTEQLPHLKNKFTSYEDFGKATLEEVVGESNVAKAINLKAKVFASMYFENDGNGKFHGHQLPVTAQFSGIHDFLVKDFDEDGKMDIICVGNMHASEVETPRNDASYGSFLRGVGAGMFEEWYPYKSGLYADGDIKHAKMIAIDGANHLLFAVNNDSLKVIRVGGQ